MNDQSRVFFGIILCVLFYFSYTKYLQNKYPQLQDSATQTAEMATSQADKSSNESAAAQQGDHSSVVSSLEGRSEGGQPTSAAIPLLTKEDLTFRTSKVVYKFNQHLASFSSIELQSYFEKPADAKEVKESSDSKHPLPKRELLDGEFILQGSGGAGISTAYDYRAKRVSDTKIEFWRQDDTWAIKQTYEFLEPGYKVLLKVDYQNISSKPQKLVASLLSQESIKSPSSGGGLLFPTGMYDPWQWRTATSNINNDIDREDLQSICDAEKASTGDEVLRQVSNGSIDFVGLDSRYFVKLVKPLSKSVSVSLQRSGFPKNQFCTISSIFSVDQGSIKPQQTVRLEFNGYFGPKDDEAFQASAPNFASSLYLGWIAVIAKPLMQAIHYIYKVVGNYGLAIIITTLLLKILFFPLTRQAAVSAHKMKEIQPIMKELQTKYKDDRQKMQLELIKVYKEHKINPAKSCLPILPTIPVFLAFYQVLMYSIDLRQAPFIFWIKDLSQKDPTFISPILLGVLMVFQMKLTPNVGMDKTQQNIMMVMPIVFTFAMISLPAGLVVYMIANTIFTILQQKMINKTLAT